MWTWYKTSASRIVFSLAIFFTAAIVHHNLYFPEPTIPTNPYLLVSVSTSNSSFPAHAATKDPSLPLSVLSRWIVDADGSRTKLACISWVSHMEAMVPEGLSKQPVAAIAAIVASSGFNCVRLTFATHMFTRAALDGRTASQSLESMGLTAAVEGIGLQNPELANLPLVDVFNGVVTALARVGIMVILDNHVSKPGWCCGEDDGNGFWGDLYFDPEEWMAGLSMAAELTRGYPNIVGMSLRNEPRGPHQNVPQWRQFMTAGAESVHAKNPDLLILMSGLSYASDLSFLKWEPLSFSNPMIRQKLVYEVHWYSWYSPSTYSTGNANSVCAADIQRVMQYTGFLLSPNEGYTSPLMVSEFGMLQSGESSNDNRFMDCFFALAAKLDLEWALWLLPGTFYFRNGQEDFVETYGLVTPGWNEISNVTFLHKLQALQRPLPEPSTEASEEAGTLLTYRALFHPITGLCLKSGCNGSLVLRQCQSNSSVWAFENSSFIRLKDSNKVITAVAEGSPAQLVEIYDLDCEGCQWSLVSDSLQLSAVGLDLCLDAKSDSTAVTTQPCLCVSPSDCVNNPQKDPRSQWFQFITLEVSSNSSRKQISTMIFQILTWLRLASNLY